MSRATQLLAFGLFILVVTLDVQAGQRLDADDIDVRIIGEDGRAFHEYPVDRKRRTYRAYVEAERSARYAIEAYNRTGYWIGLVIAVDGRNIISGTRSDLKPNERMYIVGPYERAVYQGWRSGRNRVNRFYFTDSDDSYAAAWGDYSAMGVIAVAAFSEKQGYHYEKKDQRRFDKGRAPRAKSAPRTPDEAGTGFGEEQWSPSRRVHFEPEHKPFARHFLKYEWRETLCRLGVIDCRHHTHRNRFWEHDYYDNLGFAPYPPHRRW